MNTPNVRFYLFVLIATLFSGVCFTSADFITTPVSNLKDVLVLGVQWSVVTAALSFLLLILSVHKYVFAVGFPLLTLISSVLAYFRLTMNATLTPMLLDAALENDYRTSAELVSTGLLLFVLVTFLISLLFACYRIKRISLSSVWIPLCAGLVLLFGITHIERFERPISERIPFNIYYTIMKYWEEKQIISEERVDLSAGATSSEEDLTVVLVIGESLRPDHLGLNGYKRNTTPLLMHEDIISFPSVYTEQTYTNRSIPHLLTRADSTDYERAYTEKSVVSFFKTCGFYTAWLANQESADTYAYFMNECDTLQYANMDKSSYVFDRWVDSDLYPYFDRAMQVENKKKMLILHTIGSHWWYNSHFTDEYAHFQPLVKSRVISSNTDEEMVNSYDNTILYTDYFVKGLIDRLRDRNAILIYQSDHGEGLGEDGVWLHAAESPYTHSAACFVWMSAAYKEKYPAKYKQAHSNTLKRFRTDYLWHTLLDAAEISSEYRNDTLSLFR